MNEKMMFQRILSHNLLMCRLVVFLSALTPWKAYAETVNIQYDISLIGLPIGRANLNATLTASTYTLNLEAKMTGLIGVLTQGQGDGSATGSLGEAKVIPKDFRVRSQAGEDQRTVEVKFSGKSVHSASIEPPLEEKPDRIPVLNTHKSNVIDPISALLMPVANGDPNGQPCARTLPIFDGATRFDLTLTPSQPRLINTKGFQGTVEVCKARYVPIAGHRPLRPAIKFMQANKDLEVWLAPLGARGVFMPYKISVHTMIGTVTLTAAKFVVDGSPL
jgi:hypothetical protein